MNDLVASDGTCTGDTVFFDGIYRYPRSVSESNVVHIFKCWEVHLRCRAVAILLHQIKSLSRLCEREPWPRAGSVHSSHRDS